MFSSRLLSNPFELFIPLFILFTGSIKIEREEYNI
jgi:hypothetical protein